MNYLERLKAVGSVVTAIGNCGTKKNIEVTGILSRTDNGFIVTLEKNGQPCSVYDNTIELVKIIDYFSKKRPTKVGKSFFI